MKRILRWSLRVLGGFIALAILLAVAGAVYEWMATARDLRAYPPPGQMVDVGGHRLHLYCTGEGSPTVVLEAGLAGSSLDWSWVQPEVEQFTRVCSYDRAGYAWSEPGPLPRTSRQIVHELHNLLAKAGIESPYILVGHSFGGLNIRLYAFDYQAEVVGMVLIDSSHEEQSDRLPAQWKELLASVEQQTEMAKTLARFGIPRLLNQPLVPPPPYPPGTLEQARAVGVRPQVFAAISAEAHSFVESTSQVRQIGNSLSDLPLVVLSSGLGPIPSALLPPGFPVEEMNEAWMEMQKELASRSTDSSHVIAEKSGHYIQIDQPDLVINMIRQMVEKDRQ